MFLLASPSVNPSSRQQAANNSSWTFDKLQSAPIGANQPSRVDMKRKPEHPPSFLPIFPPSASPTSISERDPSAAIMQFITKEPNTTKTMDYHTNLDGLSDKISLLSLLLNLRRLPQVASLSISLSLAFQSGDAFGWHQMSLVASPSFPRPSIGRHRRHGNTDYQLDSSSRPV